MSQGKFLRGEPEVNTLRGAGKLLNDRGKVINVVFIRENIKNHY